MRSKFIFKAEMQSFLLPPLQRGIEGDLQRISNALKCMICFRIFKSPPTPLLQRGGRCIALLGETELFFFTPLRQNKTA